LSPRQGGGYTEVVLHSFGAGNDGNGWNSWGWYRIQAEP